MIVELIRHGATELQREHRYQGRTDAPLSAEGAAALRRDVRPLRRVYVSPLMRAGQTAAILFPAAERIAVPGLEEMDFGAFEGRNFLEMEQDPAYRAWVDGGCLGRCPSGESRAAFSDRVREAFRRLMDEAAGRGETEIVIVAHGGTMMAALEAFGQPARDYYDWQRPSGGGWRLDGTAWPEKRVLHVLEATDYTESGG